jgi:hypothetical protein
MQVGARSHLDVSPRQPGGAGARMIAEGPPENTSMRSLKSASGWRIRGNS